MRLLDEPDVLEVLELLVWPVRLEDEEVVVVLPVRLVLELLVEPVRLVLELLVALVRDVPVVVVVVVLAATRCCSSRALEMLAERLSLATRLENDCSG